MNPKLRAQLQELADRWWTSVSSRDFAEDLEAILDEAADAEKNHALSLEIDDIADDLVRLGHEEGVFMDDLPDRIRAASQKVRAAEEAGLLLAPVTDETAAEKKPAPSLPPGVTSTPEIFEGEILLQSEVWKDRQGNLHRLTDMTEGYLRRVLGFVEARQNVLYQSAIQKQMAEVFNGQSLEDDWLMPAQPTDYPNAATWLRSTPLVSKIHQLIV